MLGLPHGLSRPLGFVCAVTLCLLAGCGGSGTTSLSPNSRYVIADLGASFGNSYARSINNKGEVVGYGAPRTPTIPNSTSFPFTSFVYANSKVTSLNGVNLQAINDNGQIVGDSGQYQNGAVTPISGVVDNSGAPITLNNAYAVDSQGRIAGIFKGGPNFYHAGLYANGRITDLGTLGEPSSSTGGQFPISSYAHDINNQGQVVGFSETGKLQSDNSSPVKHAFLWQNGKISDLGTLAGDYSNAFAINNKGLIVGVSTPLNTKVAHAVVWENGKIRDLDPSGQTNAANGVNDAGQIVGYRFASLPTGSSRAYVYQNGQFVDLNTLLPAGSGWVLTSASAINNKGQICGQGTYNGASHAFLLTPQ